MTSTPFRLVVAALGAAALHPGYAAETPAPVPIAAPQVYSLGDCLRIAREKNHSRLASRFAVAMAEAQPDNFTMSGNFAWLLWDGGMRKGYREQSLGGVQAEYRKARYDLLALGSQTSLVVGTEIAGRLSGKQ